MQPSTLPPRLLTVPEAAAALGLHPRTVRRHLKSGRLTEYTIPARNRLYLDATEVEAMLIPRPAEHSK